MKGHDEMVRCWGSSKTSGMKRHSRFAVVVVALLCAAPISSVLAQTTISAGSVEVLPGATAEVPISMALPSGTSCATLQFNLTVAANGGAPAIATNAGFTSLVGPPSQNINNGPATRLVGWFSNFDPLLTGTVAVGTLTVPIPDTAQSGQTYTVQVINPSGTTDGETDLPINGVNGTITIGGAPSTNSISAGSVADVPAGGTAEVPISINLLPGVQCATLQFNLTVVGTPAISTNVGFTSAVGPPSQNINNGPATRLVGWFSNFEPPLTGVTAVGTLTVPIPGDATGGATYTVQVINPSGTTDGETDLPLDGVNGTITVGGPIVDTPTQAPTSTATQPPPPTATRTVTQPPPPTSTPTHTATRTVTVPPPSPTPTRTATTGAAPVEDDDGGCQISARGDGSTAWLLLIPAVVLIVRRRTHG